MKRTRLTVAFVLSAMLSIFWAPSVQASAQVSVSADSIHLRLSFPPPVVQPLQGAMVPRVGDLPLWAEAPGRPLLPLATYTIVLPAHTTASRIEVTGAPTPIEGSFEIAWGQPPQRVGDPGGADAPRDAEVYGSDAPYPAAPAIVTGMGFFRGYRVASVAFRPVQFRPRSGRLTSFTTVELRVHLTATAESDAPAPRGLAGDIAELSGVALNPETAYTYGAPEPGAAAQYSYLIVTPERLRSAFQRLLTHRIAHGATGEIRTVESLLANYTGRDEAEKLRNAIADAYRTAGTTFVLLGGDDVDDAGQRLVPVRHCAEYDNMVSDYYFGALDGDWDADGDGTFCEGPEVDYFSELHVGRATVDTVEEANRWIDKVLAYESGLPDERRLDLVYMGEKLDNSTWGEDAKQHIAAFTPAEYVIDRLYARSGTFSAVDVIASLNRGPNLVNHVGHAGSDYVMGIGIADVEALNNPSPFFGYSIGCYSGAFDQGVSGNNEAISEHFLLAPHAAVGVVMNSRYGWYYIGGSTGLSDDLDREFYHALFVDGLHTLGEANDHARAATAPTAQSDGTMRYCFLETNLHGDPATPAQVKPNQLRYAAHRVVEANPFYGDGDGVADPGETIQIAVTLANSGAAAAHGVEAFLTSSAPGVTVRDGHARWSDIEAGASAENLPQNFTATLNLACGAVAAFRLEVRHDGGRVDVSVFTVQVGQVSKFTILEDDFEANRGWTAGGSAQQGLFVRENPNGVLDGAAPVQSEDDATPGAGLMCWMTGNPPVTPGFDPRAGDLRNGTVYIQSPAFNGTGDGRLRLKFSRWFHRSGVNTYNEGSYIVKVSGDGGTTWTDLERLDSNVSAWKEREFDLSSVIQPTNNMRVRFQATDAARIMPPEPLVELMIDDVWIYRRIESCSAFSPNETEPPNAVGPTLFVQRAGPDLALQWTRPLVDATHDPAGWFPVHRSPNCQSGFTRVGAPTEAAWVDRDAAAACHGSMYFLVSAENAAGDSGEAPTP